MIDHDRLFKELLSTFLQEFVTQFLPTLAESIQLETLSLLDKEIFTDVTSGERYEADLVARGQLRDRSSPFLLHIEIQAKAEAGFPRRQFRYFSRLHDKYGIPVYSVVIFSFDTPRRTQPSRYQVQLAGQTVLTFNYETIQLNRLHWRDFVDCRNPVACAFLAKMQMEPAERPLVKLEALRLLHRLGLNPAQVQLISGFIDTYLKLNPAEEAAFQAELANILPTEQEGVMEIVTSWMERGIEQGLEQGREQGREQGIAEVVERLLNRRFGSLSPSLQEAVRQLSVAQLEELAEALLDFENEADLEAWLNQRESQ